MRSLAIFGILAALVVLLLPLASAAQLGDEPAADGEAALVTAEENVDAGQPMEARESAGNAVPVRSIVASLTIFVLAIFVGFEIITKVPPTLHTPLMSGSNAISGITIVGALLVAGTAVVGGESTLGGVGPFIGWLAVVLATVNVVGGFLVTHRMLSMFQRKK